MKPFMAIERHMTVMASVFALLATYLVCRLSNSVAPPLNGAIAATLLAGITLPTALSTLALARSGPNDPRIVVEAIIKALDGPVAIDWHATLPAYNVWPPLSTIKASTHYVVVAESIAERFIRAPPFSDQPAAVRNYTELYQRLFDCPAIIVRSTASFVLISQHTRPHRGD